MGSEHIAQIRVIQVLPVADNWIDEDGRTQQAGDGEPNVVLTLGHRVRCWPNIKTT